MAMAQLTLSLHYGDLLKVKLRNVPGDISVADLKTRAAEKFDIIGQIHLQYYDEDDEEWLVWSAEDGLVDKQKLKVVKQDQEDQTNPGDNPQKAQDISVDRWTKKIADKLQENKQGMVFIVGMSDARGTEKDILEMQNVFARLNFALFLEHNLTANDMRNLAKAIAAYPDFPEAIFYKYIAFYYAGHGGITPNGDAVLKPVQDSNEREFVFVERDIIRPIETGLKKKCLLFLFDCCLSVASGVAGTPDLNIRSIHSSSLVAYASSLGEKAFGDKNGGYWTKTLVKHLERNERLVTILSDVNIEVRKEYNQKCTLKDNLGSPVNLKASVRPQEKSLLKKKPHLDHVFDLLKSRACDYQKFGRALKVSHTVRENIKMDNILKPTFEDKLTAVIKEWVEKQTSDVTWERLIDAMTKEMLGQLVREIREYLKNDDIKTFYASEPEWVRSVQ